jgi:hypothetical protein
MEVRHRVIPAAERLPNPRGLRPRSPPTVVPGGAVCGGVAVVPDRGCLGSPCLAGVHQF